jgi:hypothetical protein
VRRVRVGFPDSQFLKSVTGRTRSLDANSVSVKLLASTNWRSVSISGFAAGGDVVTIRFRRLINVEQIRFTWKPLQRQSEQVSALDTCSLALSWDLGPFRVEYALCSRMADPSCPPDRYRLLVDGVEHSRAAQSGNLHCRIPAIAGAYVPMAEITPGTWEGTCQGSAYRIEPIPAFQ